MSSAFDNGIQIRFNALGRGQALVSSTPTGFPSLPDLERLRRTVIRPIDGDIWFADDGLAPSAANSMLLMEGEILIYDSQFPDKFKMIARTTDVDVRFLYYGT